ncbi:esterase, PHB depolymerase family [Loktanella fryxellensis]|uniref:Esterase, PHB depolymerase family n=1 Tax=Loktanella fryxellensis TaxID=245187 RepID=A0A1H8G7E0_9RHOB|nr:PHB depolymerase family esterase [Loktanella fryxellensis]SEN39417.1 esterase, PHB depolymerase family [Loktanella fryxellensis]
MFKFNAGALHPATGDARLSAAQDLVSRTLAQHGLSGGPMNGQNGSAATGRMPDLSGLVAMASLMQQPHRPGATRPATSDHGMTAGTHRCAAGQRDYLLHVPASAQDGATGLIVMLHGCTQTAADFAAGTQMNALADRDGFVVLYPQQSRGDNAQSCWNWFSRGDQLRDRGEPAIIADLTRKVAAEHGMSPDRTAVAGLSAGGAMAVILGQTHADVFGAVGVHSGLPYSAARDVPSAFAAMAGNGADVALPSGTTTPRSIVIHGSTDTTVAPVNGDRIARHVRAAAGPATIETTATGTTNGRAWTCDTAAKPDGRIVLEHWRIDGLGHAWSGGNPAGSHTDGRGPDASAAMVRFFFGEA